MAITPDTPLENYVLEAELSQDDHFTIYQGYRKSDDTSVIIKVVAPLYTGDEFFVRRFKQIAKQAAQLEHPQIIPTDEAEQDGDLLYVAQDDIEARSLAQVIETEGPFSPQRMQFIAGQIASALDYAHQKSVIHGDLSAHQVYLGANDQVFMANFGQAQIFYGTNLVKHALAIHSPETLAPERVQGQGPSRPADLYALGILCYHMLAKQPPFTGPASSVLHAQAHKQPRPLYQLNARVSIGMSRVIGRMLSKGMELRYNTGAEFTRALAMAQHNKKPGRHFDHLTPLTERERIPAISFSTLFYVCSGLILIIFVAALFAWAGYELGLRQVDAQVPKPQLIITTTIPVQQNLAEAQLISPTTLPAPTTGISPTASPTQKPTTTSIRTFTSLTDALLPTPTLPTAQRLPGVRLVITPTLTLPRPAATPPPTPAYFIPEGQGLFIFFNPTGHDLIVDLTGPTSGSRLIPPNQRHEFLLAPGSYQYIVHTPTGEWLDTVVATFDLPPGQLVDKDYYSDFD